MVTICFGLNDAFQPQMILFHFAVFQITAKAGVASCTLSQNQQDIISVNSARERKTQKEKKICLKTYPFSIQLRTGFQICLSGVF